MRRVYLALLQIVAGPALVACSLVTDLSGLSEPGAGGAAGSGGAASATGSGGGTGSTGGSGAGGGVQCPGTAGPVMVNLGDFCIDATEVTRAQYAEFLAADVNPQSETGLPAECAWNITYEPAGAQTDGDDFPVVNVDWCDAYAYCEWAGKRLCGRIGGKESPFSEFANPTGSQWYAACSIRGTMVYPYGPYDPKVCVGSAYDGVSGVQMTDQMLQVKMAAECHGAVAPYDEIYDMSGNVSEWEDSCDGTLGANDHCHRRGGSFIFEGSDIQCADDSHSSRETTSPSNGFRCCSG